jgi:hypothetical protein
MSLRKLTTPIGTLQLDDGNTLPAIEQRVTIYGMPNADQNTICNDGHESPPGTTSINSSRGVALMSVRARENDEYRWLSLRAQCLGRFATDGISVEMLQFLPSRMRFVVVANLVETAKAVVQDCGLTWRLVPNCSKVSVAGARFPATAGIFLRALTGLAERNIPVLHFSDSDTSLSLLVPDTSSSDTERFVQSALTSGEASINSSIRFDSAFARVRVNGQERQLGSRQAKLLEFFIKNAGRVIEVEEAARYLFGTNGKDGVSAIRVHIHNLRKKLEVAPNNPRHLVTIPAQGYVFVR